MLDKSKLKPIGGSILAALVVLSFSSGAFAAGSHGGGHGHADKASADDHGSQGHAHGIKIGEPGKASEVSRTIKILMWDNRYLPERIDVEKGQTIRFVLKNKGDFVHEFNIGTAQMHTKHQNEMAMMFEHGVIEVDKIHRDKLKMKMANGRTMDHDDPNSVLLEPKQSGEIIWKFSAGTKLEFACNIPGHYQSGMMGHIHYL